MLKAQSQREVLQHHHVQQVAPERQRRLKIMCKKTKMCRFFADAACTRGENCHFAHDSEELVPTPDLSRTKICKMLRATGRCTDPTCTFAHTKTDLRYSSSKGKHSTLGLTAPMEAWTEGRCKHAWRSNLTAPGEFAPLLDVQPNACEQSGKQLQDVEEEAEEVLAPGPQYCFSKGKPKIQVETCEQSRKLQYVEDPVAQAFIRQVSAHAELSVCVKNTFISVEPGVECHRRRSKTAPARLVQLAGASELVLRGPVESPWGVLQPSSPPPRARKQGNTSWDGKLPIA